ncbi:MAG: 30S ribosome-binding factor RbfA [bacterium]
MVSPLRREKLQEAIRELIATVVHRELKDPRVGFATITKVEMTPDGRSVKVFFSVLGTAEQVQQTMEGLTKAQGFLQKRVAEHLQMRLAPRLQVVYDDSLEKAMQVQQLLKRLEEENKSHPPDPACPDH